MISVNRGLMKSHQTIQKYFSILLSSLFLFAGSASAQAVDQSTPDGLIKTVVSDVMASVKSDPEIQKVALLGLEAPVHTAAETVA